jgi:energy-coupling factor transporter ATP-binding protein EcfA2
VRLRRLRVTNVGGVRAQEVEFEPQGVTVVEGPNESGKSTLIRAFNLLLDLEDSSNHSRIRALEPKDGGGAPEVEGAFALGGWEIVYAKRWRSQPYTSLMARRQGAPEVRLRGREAHEWVAACRREALDEPLWRALQVTQGTGLDAPALGDSPSLRAALDRAAGGQLGSAQADSLFALAQSERARYYTPKQNAPTGELRAALEGRDRARAAATQAEAAWAQVEETAERIGDTERLLVETQRERDRLASERDAARTQMDRLTEVRERHGLAAERFQRARAAEQERLRAKEARQRLVEDAAQAEAAVRDLTARREAIRAEAAAAYRVADVAEARHRAALADAARLEGAARAADADLAEVRRRAEIERLTDLGERAAALTRRAAAAAAEAAAIAVTPELAERIETAHRRLVTARARFEAGAPRLSVRALRDLRLTVGGEEVWLAADQVLERTAPGRLELVVAGTVAATVSGGGESERLARDLAEAAASLDAALAAGDVATPDAARQAAQRRAACEAAAQTATETLRQLLAGRTAAELAERAEALRAQSERYLADRPAEPALPETVDRAEEEAAAARRRADVARDAEARAREERDRAREAAIERREAERSLAERLAEAQDRADAAARLLAEARAATEDAALTAALDAAGEELRQASAERDRVQDELEAMNPERIELAWRNVEERRARLEQEHVQLARRLAEDQGAMRQAALEGTGPAEQQELARSQREAAEARAEAVTRRAEAAALLASVLERHRDRALKTYREPYRQELERLGRIVFDPSFGVLLDDDLRISHRRLDGLELPFEALSAGAREQLAVLARLACAGLVSAEGVPVILDDSFGFADPERLAGLALALDEAGRRCQVVLLTCVPDRHRGLGRARIVHLSRRSAVSPPPLPAAGAAPDLTAAAARILAVLASGEPLGKREILLVSGVEEAQWALAIQELRAAGRVRVVGQRRGARYQRAGTA